MFLNMKKKDGECMVFGNNGKGRENVDLCNRRFDMLALYYCKHSPRRKLEVCTYYIRVTRLLTICHRQIRKILFQKQRLG